MVHLPPRTSFSQWVVYLFLFFVLIFVSISYAGSSGSEGINASVSNRDLVYTPSDGEEFVYRASWNGIPIASAKIHAAPLLIAGEKFYKVTIHAKSWKYVDPFWKMRDYIESVFEAETYRPRHFVFRQRENRRKVDTTANFDLETNKWVVERRKRNKVRRYEFVSRDTFDPILAGYVARSLDFKVGESFKIKVFGGKYRYLITFNVVGREQIQTRIGVFDAYKIVPKVINLSRSGYAKRVRHVTVWISADEKRRVLRIVSKVFIGSVSIEMVDVKS